MYNYISLETKASICLPYLAQGKVLEWQCPTAHMSAKQDEKVGRRWKALRPVRFKYKQQKYLKAISKCWIAGEFDILQSNVTNVFGLWFATSVVTVCTHVQVRV